MQERAKEKLMKQDSINRNEEPHDYFVKQTTLLLGGAGHIHTHTHTGAQKKTHLGQNLNKVPFYVKCFIASTSL